MGHLRLLTWLVSISVAFVVISDAWAGRRRSRIRCTRDCVITSSAETQRADYEYDFTSGPPKISVVEWAPSVPSGGFTAKALNATLRMHFPGNRVFHEKVAEVIVLNRRGHIRSLLTRKSRLKLDDAVRLGRKLCCHFGIANAAIDEWYRDAQMNPNESADFRSATDSEPSYEISVRRSDDKHGPWFVSFRATWSCIPKPQ